MLENEVDSLKKLISYGAEQYGDRDFILFKRDNKVNSRNFIDLKRDSNAVSRMFDSMGINNVHFALGGNTSYEWIISFFGIVNSNNIVVPYDKKEVAEELEKVLEHADIEGIIFDRTQKKKIDYIRKHNKNIKYFISLDSSEDEGDIISLQSALRKYQGEYLKTFDNENVSVIMYSSGTTGERKGVMLTSKGFARDIMNFREKTFMEKSARKLSVLPIHHAFCFTCDVLSCIRFGYTLCVGTSIGSIFADAKLYHPTRMSIVPAVAKYMYSMILKEYELHKNVPIKDIAREMLGGEFVGVACGGAFTENKVLENLNSVGILAYVGYGMTECSPTISSSSSRHNKLGSVGRPLYNTQVKIVDNQIVIKSESLMKGYYKNEKATKESMQDGWFKTGDYGYLDEDGYLFITGRKKNLIILENGENVSPEEIEAKIYEEPIVKEVIVYSKDNKICAQIFPNRDTIERLKIDDIKEEIARVVFRVNKKLPVYKKIEKFIVRDKEFEKTSSNKIKRDFQSK